MSHSVGLQWGPSTCISTSFQAGPGATLAGPVPEALRPSARAMRPHQCQGLVHRPRVPVPNQEAAEAAEIVSVQGLLARTQCPGQTQLHWRLEDVVLSGPEPFKDGGDFVT